MPAVGTTTTSKPRYLAPVGSLRTSDHIKTPLVPPVGHLYGTRGDRKVWSSVNLPYDVGDGWAITSDGSTSNQVTKEILHPFAENVLSLYAPWAWLIAADGIQVNGQRVKGGVLQRSALNPLTDSYERTDMIVLDTSGDPAELFEIGYRVLWADVIEPHLAYLFPAEFLAQLTESCLADENPLLAMTGGTDVEVRTRAWMRWISQHSDRRAGLLEAPEEYRLPHEDFFLKAMTGELGEYIDANRAMA